MYDKIHYNIKNKKKIKKKLNHHCSTTITTITCFVWCFGILPWNFLGVEGAQLGFILVHADT